MSTVTAKALISAKYAGSSNTVEYTAGAGTHTIIDKFTATNTDGSSRTLTVYLVPSGGVAGGDNQIIDAVTIATTVTQDFTELQNHILNPGDTIVVVASVASKVTIRASGREIS